jgi:hypothetical protein
MNRCKTVTVPFVGGISPEFASGPHHWMRWHARTSRASAAASSIASGAHLSSECGSLPAFAAGTRVMPTGMLVRLATFWSTAPKPHNDYIVVALLALPLLFISLFLLTFSFLSLQNTLRDF